MNVYINAVSARFAEKLGSRTSNMLGQPLSFPYFNAFKEPLLSLKQLYHYIDLEIDRTLQRAGWDKSDLKNIPILLGSTAYMISDCKTRVAHHQALPKEYNLTAIAEDLGNRYQTEVFSFATSCTSSAQAIGYAYKMLKVGMYKKALVVGFEMFNRLTFEHFQSMNLLSQANEYQPFINSTGIVLGEGVGSVALSTEKNESFLCEIFGITTITDNENLTNSSETALRQLLTNCLVKTNLKIENIQGIKVHGVGGNSDEMEQSVLQELFVYTASILVNAYMGHTQSASGASEAEVVIEHL